MSLSFDVDLLIAEIESKPVLWDSSNKYYYSQEKRRVAWSDIGRIVVPNFVTLSYLKQSQYVEEMKRKYQSIRKSYHKAWKKGLPYAGPQLSFLHKVWKFSPSGENSIEAGEKNAQEVQKCNEEISTTENSRSSSTNSLKPVLSIKKIDAALSNMASSSKREKPPKRQSEEQQKVELPKRKKPIVHQEQPTVDCEKEESGGAKSFQYRCEVQMASTQNNTSPRPISKYASLSFEDDGQLTERRILRSLNFDLSNNRPSDIDDSYYDRPRNNDMCIERPVQESGSAPPQSPSSPMRRQESYFNPRRFPMIPTGSLDYHDDDMAFFRSLLPWTKRFGEDEKLKFRSEVIKLISKMGSKEPAEK